MYHYNLCDKNISQLEETFWVEKQPEEERGEEKELKTNNGIQALGLSSQCCKNYYISLWKP